MKKNPLSLVIIMLMAFSASGQVGIGTTEPDTSSILHLSSTTQGFLLPRMTTSERDLISAPASGLLIFNMTTHMLESNSNTPISPEWTGITGATGATGATGPAGPTGATGTITTVPVGAGNTATGANSSAVGGTTNNATGVNSSALGGTTNNATGANSSTIGGTTGVASGVDASVVGGTTNTASGAESAVIGGSTNTASGIDAIVAGGTTNLASGSNAGILGGTTNTASGVDSTIIGGTTNTASAANSSVIGGSTSIASGINSAVLGGTTNTASGLNAVVTGGTTNVASGSDSIASGVSNFAPSFGEWSGGVFGTNYSAASATGFSAGDRIFNIGNGSSGATRSDALTVYKDGLVLLPSVTNALIAAADGKAVITKEYADAFYTKFGTTAPSSSTSTGIVGEIRITATFIYYCYATNSWVRSAVASW